MAFSAPGTLSILALLPVATITSSALREVVSFTSVLNFISMPRSFISFSYHFMSSRSFSLNSGAAAAMNTPPSLSLFS